VRLNGGGTPRPPVLTDGTGQFAFSSLPRGSYELTVEKTTYLMAQYPERGQSLRSVMQRVTLADGQALDGIVVRMFHGSAISGRIVDARGDPVEGIGVQALRVPRSGRTRPQMRGGASTNDLGEFRLARLEPGTYLLYVQPSRFGPQDDPADTQPAPTFYPGVSSIEQAQPIVIERGMSVNGIDLTLVDAPVVTVTGVVLDRSGQPVSNGASVNARAIVKELPISWGTAGTGVKPDGTFTLKLTPGEYQIDVQSMMHAFPGAPQPSDEQFGGARLTVNADISGLAIQLGSGATVSGRFVFDGSSPLPSAPPTSNGPQPGVVFAPLEGQMCRMGRTDVDPDFTFHVDNVFGTCVPRFFGSFGRWTVKAILYDGKDLLERPVMLGAGQRLRDVQVILTDKRSDVAFNVTDERGQTTHDFVALVFAVERNRWTEGSRYVRTFVPPPIEAVANSGGGVGAVESGTVFIGAMAGGVAGSMGSISHGMVTLPAPGPVGMGGAPMRRDSMIGLPPGEYYAVAVDDADPDVLRDPDLLERLSRAAVRVTVDDVAKTAVSLRVTKFADAIGAR
jgi:hypothetical protein